MRIRLAVVVVGHGMVRRGRHETCRKAAAVCAAAVRNKRSPLERLIYSSQRPRSTRGNDPPRLRRPANSSSSSQRKAARQRVSSLHGERTGPRLKYTCSSHSCCCFPCGVSLSQLSSLPKMAFRQKVQKVMVQPISLIFRFLQNVCQKPRHS